MLVARGFPVGGLASLLKANIDMAVVWVSMPMVGTDLPDPAINDDFPTSSEAGGISAAQANVSDDMDMISTVDLMIGTDESNISDDMDMISPELPRGRSGPATSRPGRK